MVEGNYERIVEKIALSSGLDKDEIERKIEAKRAKLSGLISKEGASQIVAAELGISFDNEKLKIHELLPGMRKVNVVGQVINLFPVRSFTTKKGEEGKVANMIIADDTSNIKVVLWDTNHIELIEKNEVQEGSVIHIINGSMRDNEIHLGSFSEFKQSSEVFDKVIKEKVVKQKNIADFRIGDGVSTRAFIVHSFEPKFFYVCPECKKKAVQQGDGSFLCATHGKVSPEKRALINIVLDDGTENIRSVLFHEKISSLGLTDLENPEKLSAQRADLAGKEMIFSGDVRNNNFFNTPEFIVNDVKIVDVDEIIAGFENN